MRLRLIGIRFSGLVRGTYQINLFEDTEEMLSLYQAMDRMKSRYGFDAVMRCEGEYFDTAHFTNSLKNSRFRAVAVIYFLEMLKWTIISLLLRLPR